MLVDMRIRAQQSLRELAKRHTGQTIVLVGHTVINRVIIMEAMDIPDDHFGTSGRILLRPGT